MDHRFGQVQEERVILVLVDELQERWTKIKRVALVTNAENGEKLMHHIAFTLQTRT